VAPVAFGSLLAGVVVAGGVGLVVVSGLGLGVVVVCHRRLSGSGATVRRGGFRSPIELMLTVGLVVGLGGVVAVLAAMFSAAAASSSVGDGSSLVGSLLVVFVLAPCLAVGHRCGRWWAFFGAAVLVPMLGFCLLLAGRHSASSVGFVVAAVLATAFALAAGSFQRELTAADVTALGRRRSPPADVAAREPAHLAARSAAGTGRRVGASSRGG
jgi:hypothetical protein